METNQIVSTDVAMDTNPSNQLSGGESESESMADLLHLLRVELESMANINTGSGIKVFQSVKATFSSPFLQLLQYDPTSMHKLEQVYQADFEIDSASADVSVKLPSGSPRHFLQFYQDILTMTCEQLTRELEQKHRSTVDTGIATNTTTNTGDDDDDNDKGEGIAATKATDTYTTTTTDGDDVQENQHFAPPINTVESVQTNNTTTKTTTAAYSISTHGARLDNIIVWSIPKAPQTILPTVTNTEIIQRETLLKRGCNPLPLGNNQLPIGEGQLPIIEGHNLLRASTKEIASTLTVDFEIKNKCRQYVEKTNLNLLTDASVKDRFLVKSQDENEIFSPLLHNIDSSLSRDKLSDALSSRDLVSTARGASVSDPRDRVTQFVDNCDPGHQECDSGHQDCDSGHQDCDSGHQECDSGHQECDSVHQDCDSGHQDCDPGHQGEEDEQEEDLLRGDRTSDEELEFTQINDSQCRRRKKKSKPKKDYETLYPFKYFCSLCSFKTKRQSHYDNHRYKHLLNPDMEIFQCKMCDYKTIRASCLQRHHLQQHTTTHDIVACDFSNCKFQTTSHKLLQKHQVWKHPQKETSRVAKLAKQEFVCKTCDYRGRSFSLFERHLKSHQLGEITLEVANNDIEESESMAEVTVQLPMDGANWFCPACCYESRIKEHIIRHVKNVHSQTRSFLCEECGKSFKRQDTLKIHKLVHQDNWVKKYTCPETWCQKKFRSKTHLTEHLSSHSDVRAFLCEICGQKFKTRSVQRYHIRTIHKQPRSYRCSVCDKLFNTKFALQRHAVRHPNTVHFKPETEVTISANNVQFLPETNVTNSSASRNPMDIATKILTLSRMNAKNDNDKIFQLEQLSNQRTDSYFMTLVLPDKHLSSSISTEFNHQVATPTGTEYNHQVATPTGTEYNHQVATPTGTEYNHQVATPTGTEYSHQEGATCQVLTDADVTNQLEQLEY